MSYLQPSGRSVVLIEDIPHLPQESSWDCGLACLTMVLRGLIPELTDNDISDACRRHKLGESVWTIDLAYLCSILGIRHHFYTQTLGVDKNYANESFYIDNMKADFTDEETRVNRLFENASRSGVNVEKKSVSLEEILMHLEKFQPVIVLINDNILRPHLGVQDSHSAADEDICFLWRYICLPCYCGGYSSIEGEERQTQANTEFWGHYVVIVGYNLNERIFILNDPTTSGKHVTCSFYALDEARKSYGSDEDILFIFAPEVITTQPCSQ